ncbi:nucleoside-diphosphate sugar epimerase [Knoellia sinensis KCTC 19936]|uniref:Nucleoside-diphosphate sugar epimerase n=1 Tax=Knoellia sinensis KCTC 19936 TaxID=1385520 RepID=A0A0A0J6E5_9MICO|nr:nucleoside-diphosphate sugar epimerase [Knoellia sinensis KCTC 19936]
MTRALVDRGVSVRAAVHLGRRSTVHESDLVRVVPVDLVSGMGVEAAVAGASAVYHMAPNVDSNEVRMASHIADSAVRQGVSRLVYHSVLHPEDASMPHHLRKAKAETTVRTRLESTTILRPSAYLQNLEREARSGRIEVPYSVDTPFSNVDLDDIAQIAADALLGDEHAGETYDLAGPEELTVREMAGIAADVLGHPVDAVRLPLEEWVADEGSHLVGQARADLVAMFRCYDREGLVGNPTTLRTLLGREPCTWADVLYRPTASPASMDR